MSNKQHSGIKLSWITAAKDQVRKAFTPSKYAKIQDGWMFFDTIGFEFLRLLTAWLRIKGYRWKRVQVYGHCHDDMKLCLATLDNWLKTTCGITLTNAQRFDLTQNGVFNCREVKVMWDRQHPISHYMKEYLTLVRTISLWTKTSVYGKPQRYALPAYRLIQFADWADGVMNSIKKKRGAKPGAIGFSSIRKIQQFKKATKM